LVINAGVVSEFLVRVKLRELWVADACSKLAQPDDA